MELNDILISWMDFYNPSTKTYTYRRGTGLYANLIWVIRKIVLLELNNFPVENLGLILDEYVHSKDIYNELFEKKDFEINFSNISEERKHFFINGMDTSAFGLSRNVKDIDFEILSQVIKKFFNPSQSVINLYNELLSSNNIDIQNNVFIWARQTDKPAESRIPEVKEYIKLLDSLNLHEKEIVVQTDDIRVLNDFKNSKVNFKTIKEIPISDGILGFHNEIKEFTDEEFEKKYNCSKLEHLQQMYCLSLFAKNAYKTILYPGNPTTFVPLIKGSFENCYLFKDERNLF